MKTKARPSTSSVSEASATPPALSLKVGRLEEGSTPACLTVDFDGNTAGPLKARSTVLLDEAGIRQAIATRQGVLLAFENGDPELPIITGLLVPEPGAALFASLLHGGAAAAAAKQDQTKPDQANLDGRHVVIQGDADVVLRCGDASITLRRDGKLILRGAYIETTAEGVNRIRGGSVKIN